MGKKGSDHVTECNNRAIFVILFFDLTAVVVLGILIFVNSSPVIALDVLQEKIVTTPKASHYPQAPDLRDVEIAKILPITDPARDHENFDPRSPYAETFWLPVLGPSTMWLLRKVADRFDHEPEGFELDLLETSHSLGITGKGGRNSAFHRALNRAVSFHMGRTVDDTTIAIRRFMPPIHQGQVSRLPVRLQKQHEEVMTALPRSQAEDLARAHKIALTLLNMGDSPDLVEQQLISWGLGANLAKEAVDSAWIARARDETQWDDTRSAAN